MKGIILAGGKGTRLYPLTKVIAKQLLPVYDKPMLYYSLSILMLGDIRDILIITTPNDQRLVKDLLFDGSQFGIKLTYKEQLHPNGIAEGIILGEDFIGDDKVCLILGDNIFYGNEIIKYISSATKLKNGAIIFGYYIENPERYGVISFDDNKKINRIIEKPKKYVSNYAIPGLYFYDNTVISKAKKLKPSQRGELEITDLHNIYLQENTLDVLLLPKDDVVWFDTGTYDSLLEASFYMQNIVKTKQEYKIGCLKEIALEKNWI